MIAFLQGIQGILNEGNQNLVVLNQGMKGTSRPKNLGYFLRPRLDGDAVRNDLISILGLVACSQLGLIISVQQEP